MSSDSQGRIGLNFSVASSRSRLAQSDSEPSSPCLVRMTIGLPGPLTRLSSSHKPELAFGGENGLQASLNEARPAQAQVSNTSERTRSPSPRLRR